MTQQATIDKQIFAPGEVSSSAVNIIRDRHESAAVGIVTGISTLDEVLLPHRPGELRTILGYTSNYKSGLMNYIARNHAKRVQAQNVGNLRRSVITVTWEQSIEEQGITDIAQLGGIDTARMMAGKLTDTEWQGMMSAANRRGALPWWLIGHSSEGNARRPRLTMSDLARVLEYAQDVQGLHIDLIVLDYLQRIKREGGDTIREGFIDIVDRAKDMALAYHCPVLLGAQAGRKVKDKAWRLPTADDGQETSNLEQSSDSLLSVWMPKNDYPMDAIIEYGAHTFKVTPNLLIVGIEKQKFGQSRLIRELRVQPEVNEIYAPDYRPLNGE